MGYIRDGEFIQSQDWKGKLMREIEEETKRVYEYRYGNRDPATLSTKELEAVSHEAQVRVQDRRRGRLIP